MGAVLAAVLPGSVVALDLSFAPDLKSAGWRVHIPRGKDAAEFLVDDAGHLTVRASAQVAFLYTIVPDDPQPGQTLSWSWRVDQNFPGTDLSKPGSDDRPIAVHVYFTDQKTGLLKKLGRGMAAMFGVPVSGRAITYVWGGRRPARTMIPNPFMDDGEGVLVVQRSPILASNEKWIEETVDLAADYLAAFGGEPTPVSVVAISADTDDTGAKSLSQVRDLRLLGGLNEPR